MRKLYIYKEVVYLKEVDVYKRSDRTYAMRSRIQATGNRSSAMSSETKAR